MNHILSSFCTVRHAMAAAFLLFFAPLMAGCGGGGDNGGDNGGADVKLSATEITLPAAGGTETVTVSGATSRVSAVLVDATASRWLTVLTATEGGRGTITLTATANQYDQREAKVQVRCGDFYGAIIVKQAAPEQTQVPTPDGYRLVWADEFDKSGELNAQDWTHEVQPAGWVNNELQTYVNGQHDGQRVTEVKDGHLQIHCFSGGDGKIYSGRVYAHVDTGWQYGYFEARIKLPSGKGTWPAWWMMPVNNNFQTDPWPGCGEIDIMEEVGVDPNQVSATIHCTRYNNGNTPTEHGGTTFADAEGGWHVYACEWTSQMLRFIYDDQTVLTYTNDGSGKAQWPFDRPFYPILNLAWGGSWGGYKGVDPAALPVTMEVDYVRVFQKK